MGGKNEKKRLMIVEVGEITQVKVPQNLKMRGKKMMNRSKSTVRISLRVCVNTRKLIRVRFSCAFAQ